MSFLESLRQWIVALMLFLFLGLLGLILTQIMNPPEQTPEMVQILLTESAAGQPPPPAPQWSEPAPMQTEPEPLPAQSQRTYIVRSGDTLYDIALRHNLTLDQLIEANRQRLPNPDRLAPGDELIIPEPSP
jgi:nucleoid-associated protein YgaU